MEAKDNLRKLHVSVEHLEIEKKDLDKRMKATQNERTEIHYLLEKLQKDRQLIQKQK